MKRIAGPAGTDDEAEPPRLWPVFRAALALVLCFVATAAGWAMYARLDSAVVLHGVLLAESRRKSVEHLEGGILKELLVASGDRVTAGQVVARLDPTQAQSLLVQLEAERAALSVRLARLAAEGAGRAPALDAAAAAVGRPELAAAEDALHAARLAAHEGQLEALRRRIEQFEGQIRADGAQAEAAARQIALLADERERTRTLVVRGAAPALKLHEYDRSIALLEGEREERLNLVSASRSGAAQAMAQVAALGEQRLVEAGEEAGETRRRLETLESQIRAARDRLDRLELRAPQAGTIVDIDVVSPGAVLAPGAPLMEIVPDGDRLVAEARLPPEAIDTVHPGRPAEVRLIAYRRSDAPVVPGEVIYVSADLLEDARDGSAYFVMRVALDAAALAALPGVSLGAGMPVEVAVVTGARRAGDYMLEPYLRHMRRAFREE